MMTKQLTILITGASSGIGKACAHEFAKHGYRIIICGRRKERLEELAGEIRSGLNAKIFVLSFDIRNEAACRDALDTLPSEWRDIDILLNNAGQARGLKPIHKGDTSHWESMIDTNLKGLLYMTRLISPRMVRQRTGHIINIGSTAGKEVYPMGNVYCATKFAVDALTKAFRLDLHAFGIRVSQISPGHVEETEFAMVRFDGDQERAKIYEEFRPLQARDVAEMVYFVASRPAHVNIQDILAMGTQQASSVFIDKSGRADR